MVAALDPEALEIRSFTTQLQSVVAESERSGFLLASCLNVRPAVGATNRSCVIFVWLVPAAFSKVEFTVRRYHWWCQHHLCVNLGQEHGFAGNSLHCRSFGSFSLQCGRFFAQHCRGGICAAPSEIGFAFSWLFEQSWGRSTSPGRGFTAWAYFTGNSWHDCCQPACSSQCLIEVNLGSVGQHWGVHQRIASWYCSLCGHRPENQKICWSEAFLSQVISGYSATPHWVSQVSESMPGENGESDYSNHCGHWTSSNSFKEETETSWHWWTTGTSGRGRACKEASCQCWCRCDLGNDPRIRRHWCVFGTTFKYKRKWKARRMQRAHCETLGWEASLHVFIKGALGIWWREIFQLADWFFYLFCTWHMHQRLVLHWAGPGCLFAFAACQRQFHCTEWVALGSFCGKNGSNSKGWPSCIIQTTPGDQQPSFPDVQSQS